MVASKPTILFLHGAYHPPACYRSLITKIEAAGLEVITPRLASLGKDASGTLEDDLSVVHAAAGLLIESGKDVVIVAHSYGGFVAMNAASYLISTGQGKKGNLKSIVYISGLLAEKHSIALAACNPKLVDENGPDLVEVFDIQMNGGLPIATLKDNARARYYHHEPAPAEEVEKAFSLLEPQCPAVFYIPSPYGPSDVRVPQTYISPDEDRVVLQESQDGFIAAGNMKAVKMPGCGHAPFLNDPQRVAGVIVEAATGP